MNCKKIDEKQYEIYLPGAREWTTLDALHKFLKTLQNRYTFFEEGRYFIKVTTNKMGTLFKIEQLDKYFYKKDVDLKIELYHLPFYVKSPLASVFQQNCYFYHGLFYGMSSQIVEGICCFEQVERVSKTLFERAKTNGVLIKKRRVLSPL